jgi:hypothetical protein
MSKFTGLTRVSRSLWERRRWWWAVAPFVAVGALTFQNCALDSKFQSKAAGTLTQASLSAEEYMQGEDDPPDHKLQPTTYELVLADRYYIQSLMEDIFGPSAAAADSVKVFENAKDFGSPCALYESYLDKDRKLANSMENCGITSTARLNSHVMPIPTAARQGLMTRACSDWTQNTKTMSHALARIGPKIPAATRANVVKLYRLFYRGKPDPDTSVVESLQLILNYGGAPSYNAWRSAFFTVCASSYWQVL